MDYAQAIYNANIPYRPGVYLVYSLSMEGEDNELLYFGKAGVTGNVNDSVISNEVEWYKLNLSGYTII